MLNYYQNKPKFNDVPLRENLPKIKDGTCTVNLNAFESVGTHWIALYVNGHNVTPFDSLGDEHFPKEMKKFRRQQKYYNKYL